MQSKLREFGIHSKFLALESNIVIIRNTENAVIVLGNTIVASIPPISVMIGIRSDFSNTALCSTRICPLFILKKMLKVVILTSYQILISVDKEPYFVVVPGKTSRLFSEMLPVWQI